MALSRDSKGAEGWTSVVFSTDGIVVARVQRRTDSKPVVVALSLFAHEGTELDALKRLRGANPLLKGNCTTLLRHGQYQLVQVESPNVPREEMRDAIRWRVKEMVDFPIEQAGIDVLEIPAAQTGRAAQVYAVVASHAALTPVVRLFQQAKVPLAAIDIPELAQRNVANLFEQEHRGVALLAFDSEGGRLTFSYQGELFVSRHIDVDRNALAKADDSLGGLYERVLLDVQRSLDNFDRNYSFITLSRLLVAPLPGAEGFVDYLKANLYQPVEVMDLNQVLDLSEVPAYADPARQGEALLAIGAALRDGGAA